MLLKIMDYTGHSTIEFNKADAKIAEEKFYEKLKEGHVAYTRPAPDAVSRRITDFNDVSEETLLRPQLKGG
jgi:hypothetical protein